MIYWIYLLFLESTVALVDIEVLGSSVSILINNDLQESTSPLASSSVLVLDPATLDDGYAACKSLGESLWSPERASITIQAHLQYLAYRPGGRLEQEFWINPLGDDTRTIRTDANISQAWGKSKLPVLCTQTAPYSTKNTADSTLPWQITVKSNSDYITGFRDRRSFRFLGVRYAPQPQRWSYSQLYVGNGTKSSALDYADICMRGTATGVEDCLFLNIYTPYIPGPWVKSSVRLRPVMFWIHGGAFTGGSGSDTLFDGGNLASRGDVVVVTINYRLGSLGFLAIDDGTTHGNYGFADQITALDWVRRHIRDFGGDPDRITIFGQSAGAASVRAHLASPKSKGKFAAAIMQSNLGGLNYGTTYSHYYTVQEQMKVIGDSIIEAAGCAGATPRIDCLRQLPARNISTLSQARYLVVDGDYLVSDHLMLDVNSSAARVPLLVGHMRDDGSAEIHYPAQEQSFADFLSASGYPPSLANSGLFPVPEGPNQTLNVFNATSRVATDGIFRCIAKATAYAGFLNKLFPSVYFYQFNRSYQPLTYQPNGPLCNAPPSADSPNGDPGREYYKCHSGELLYVFGNILRQDMPLRDSEDLLMEQYIVDTWTSFARTHNPVPDVTYLEARGYISTLRAVQQAESWEPLNEQNLTFRWLQWPPNQEIFKYLEQCNILGLPLKYLS